MNFKKFLGLVHIFALQQKCLSSPSIEDFRTVPRFFEADLDMNGCISPYEYKTLSEAVLRATRMTYRTLLRAHGQQGKFQRPQLQLSAHLSAFIPQLVGNTSRLVARGALPSPDPKAHFALHQEDGVVNNLGVSAALSSDEGSTRKQGVEVQASVGRVLASERNCGEEVKECSWLNHTGIEYVLLCNDGSYCNGLEGEGEGEGWACCQHRGKRAQCPSNWPVMCARANSCAQETDYCCLKSCTADGEGGGRPCYPGCTDAALDDTQWKDSEEDSCEDYYVLDYCNTTGGYGSGWASKKGGSFANYSVNGVSALEACCTCGGGLYPPPPPPLLPLLPPPPPPQPTSPPPLPVAPPGERIHFLFPPGSPPTYKSRH
ncbi:hypothetical protein CYMTET_8880 [Cymbomonas tetramitiformis]|uniref:EF-hand domain-containing protein n=1 Tax=Cymbomonas tetramitiformis TaxID=36881 RepID=A0AAE0GSS5_9CHLO|nr:hypothetical protein CYMTET_8880 [Cymbomonas tetramitiformis]